MVHSLYHLIGLLFLDITLLCYYINLRSSIILHLSYADKYLSVSFSFSFVSRLFFGEGFETLVILSAVLFPIKSSVTSTVF